MSENEKGQAQSRDQAQGQGQDQGQAEARGSEPKPATKTPKPTPRKTPRPGKIPSSRGTETSGVGRHSRIIAQRSSVNPMVITIVAIGILGFIGIVVYSVMDEGEPPAPPASGARPASPRQPAAPRAAPAAAPVPVAAPAVAPPRPAVKTRRPRAGQLGGTISPEGRDSRTFSWSCPCGAVVQAGDATCPSCSAKLQWPESIPCPFCHPPRGSGVCALCRGGETRRMMGMEIRCPLCDGTKKCRRCKGTGKFKLK